MGFINNYHHHDKLLDSSSRLLYHPKDKNLWVSTIFECTFVLCEASSQQQLFWAAYLKEISIFQDTEVFAPSEVGMPKCIISKPTALSKALHKTIGALDAGGTTPNREKPTQNWVYFSWRILVLCGLLDELFWNILRNWNGSKIFWLKP